MPTDLSIKGIFEWLFSTPLGWLTTLGTLATGAVTLGIDKKLGFDIKGTVDKVTDFFLGLFHKLIGTAEKAVDPESETMNKAVASRLDDDNSFAAVETATGVSGLGKKLRDMAKESAAEGGDPINNGLALHKKMVALIVSEWKTANPTQPVTAIKDTATKWVDGFTGLSNISEDTKREDLPLEISYGYVGLLQQAKKAKDEDSTLSESQVKPIELSPELKKLIASIASGGAAPAPDAADKPVIPPKPAKPAPAASK